MLDQPWDDAVHPSKKIDIKVCTCGSVHLKFFGQTNLHLSQQEFLEFARGISRVSLEIRGVNTNGQFEYARGVDH